MTLPNDYENTGEPYAAPKPHETIQTLGANAVNEGAPTLSNELGAETFLSPEQHRYALAAITSMSETLGLNPDDIRYVLDDSAPDNRRVVVVDASPNGQHIGLYQQILERRQADPAWYTIEIDGQRVDPLTGCTEAVYRAMIADARARGVKFLPDSLALNQHNGHVWTATMLTGEPLPADGKIWIGSSSGGKKVNFVEHPINRGGKSFVVRPAVVVGQMVINNE